MGTMTYTPIATTTLSSAAASITFSSIPSTYTDLRIIFVGTTDASGKVFRMQFNSDTGTNYSITNLIGDGTSASSNKMTSTTYIKLAANGSSTTIPSFITCDIFSYAGSTYKTLLAIGNEDQNGSGLIQNTVGLWQSTSAINTILVYVSSGNFATGTTATLYGITKA